MTDWMNPDDAIIIASPLGSGGYGLTVVKNGTEYSFLIRFYSRVEAREWAEDWLKEEYADRVEEVTPCRSCGEPYSLGDTGICFDCTVNR